MDNFKGCLFVNGSGLFKMYCPFWVICVADVGKLSVGDVLKVTDIKTSQSGCTVFQINRQLYFHHYFTLYNYK